MAGKKPVRSLHTPKKVMNHASRHDGICRIKAAKQQTVSNDQQQQSNIGIYVFFIMKNEVVVTFVRTPNKKWGRGGDMIQ